MKFSASTVIAFLASPLMVLAQNANPFNIPTTGLTASAGQSVTLNWQPTTQGTVSLILRSGASGTLNEGEPIAQSIPNSGSYTWSVPSSIVRGSDYTVEIVSDSNRDQVNYTPQFVIDSTNTVPTTRASSGSASATTGTTRTGSTTGTATTGTTTGTSASGTTSTTGTTGSTTGTSSSSGTSSRNTASTSGAGFQSTSSSASGQSTGGAPRATAAAGMMGLIALGAMAL